MVHGDDRYPLIEIPSHYVEYDPMLDKRLRHGWRIMKEEDQFGDFIYNDAAEQLCVNYNSIIFGSNLSM